MPQRAVSVLHAIHDFLPRHRAGSEIYLLSLCQELQNRHHVTVLCADYAPELSHASLTWRLQDGVPVVELTNNWEFSGLRETYDSPVIGSRLREVLEAVRPDVVHVHNLLNLSLALPAIARETGIPVVATLHDYTLVCPSGGQRVHRSDQHVCHTIDIERCARCFRESGFYDLMTVGRLASATRLEGPLPRVARSVLGLLSPALAGRVGRAVRRTAGPAVTPQDIADRLDMARGVFEDIGLFVAPSSSIAEEYARLGLSPDKLRVADYGFSTGREPSRRTRPERLRIGYVGSLVWHKGVHVLIDSLKLLPEQGWEAALFGDPSVAPSYVATLEHVASDLPVRFMGPFRQDALAEVYDQIDVLVVPSLWLENSPLVIHEAFMMGVPVVGARIGGIQDLITEGVDGLLYDPWSPAALAEALRTLIESPHRLQQLVEGAPAVRSIEEDAAQWEAIYAEAMADRKS